MSTETKLRVFTNDYEWVIARDATDAALACAAETGGDIGEERWTACPDGAPFSLWINAAGEVDEPHAAGATRTTKPFSQWAERGRGYLATTEF